MTIQRTALFIGLAAVVGLSACKVTPSSSAQPEVRSQQPQNRAVNPAGVIFAGRVVAPAGIISADGASIIAAGSHNFVVLAENESGLAGSEVFLADVGGNPIPGIKHSKTDTQGNFTIENVPPGYTFMVAAKVQTGKGNPALLKALGKSDGPGATVNIATASTFATEAAVDGKNGPLGDLNLASYQSVNGGQKPRNSER